MRNIRNLGFWRAFLLASLTALMAIDGLMPKVLTRDMAETRPDLFLPWWQVDSTLFPCKSLF